MGRYHYLTRGLSVWVLALGLLTWVASVQAESDSGLPLANPKDLPDAMVPMAPPRTDTEPQAMQEPPVSVPVTSMIVPVETVLYIRLKETLSSETNQVGDVVSAIIDEPLHLGPYTVIPTGTEVEGKVAHINNQINNDGYNPYVVVKFDKLKRAGDPDFIAFDGTLIAYKSGMRKQDYVWRLPKPGDRKRSHIKNVIGGAVSGAMFNPIIGPPLGMGVGLFKSMFANKIAHGGNVTIQPEKVLPIAVHKPFMVTMTEAAMNPTTTEEPSSPESTLREESPAETPTAR